MKNKLAGHQPLQDAIGAVLADTRAKMKMAAARRNPEVEQTEKTAAAEPVLDATNHEDIAKLAGALDEHAELLLKEADSIENGGESHQGGEQLPTQSPTGGKQSAKKDGSKKHAVPAPTTTSGTKDNKGGGEAMKTDDERAPGGTGAKYPEKGPLKTAGVKEAGARDRVGSFLRSAANSAESKFPNAAFKARKTMADHGKKIVGGAAGVAGFAAGRASKKEKKAGVELLRATLAKMAESEQGGMVLSDDKSGNNPKPAMVPGRSLIQDAQQIKNVTKAEAKAPRKKEIAEVLTEPAMSKATDKKVHENLRNATKGGVKIAAARALLQKIAEEGCTCEGSGSCRHCKMTEAAKSVAK